MPIASLPLNEDLRLQDLYMYEILDSESENEFDELLEVATQIYGCRTAAITFIDSNRQWFKAKKGIDVNETSRDIAFCAHTILRNEILIVNDATLDKRFCNNPAVSGEAGVRFYAGAPIVSQAGYNLGAVCVADTQPRELSKDQSRTLTIISKQISKLLELRLKNKLLKIRAEEQLRLEKLLLRKTLQEHEDERLSISTELHENIAQSLAATNFYLGLAAEGDSAKDEFIRKSKENIQRILNQVRQLSTSITPTTLKDFSLKDLLEEMVIAFHKRSGMIAKLSYQGNERVEPNTAIALYRIVEEQLENISQHSKATSVIVSMEVHQSIRLIIYNNGVGTEFNHLKKGVSLNKILSRAEGCSGSATVSKGVKGGYRLLVEIPLQNLIKQRVI